MDYDFAQATAQPPAIVAAAPVVGGFKPVAANTPEARTAVETALKLIRTVGEMETTDLSNPKTVSVERQVVAGTNYRVTVQVGPAAERHTIRVDYFKNLKGAVELKQVYFDKEPIMGT
ncbi:MAG: cystatin domain-containing protein [Candidatus Sericytochromatia bacterium]